MISSFLVLKGTFKNYTVTSKAAGAFNNRGRQEKTATTSELKLSVWDKGTKLVKNLGKSSKEVHLIHIYTKAVLNTSNEVPFKGRTYTVSFSKECEDINFYEAISNV